MKIMVDQADTLCRIVLDERPGSIDYEGHASQFSGIGTIAALSFLDVRLILKMVY